MEPTTTNVVDEQLEAMTQGIADFMDDDNGVEFTPFTPFSGIPGAYVTPCVVDPDHMH